MFRTNTTRMVLATALLALGASPAMSAGTAAGEAVVNSFSMSYSSGGGTIQINDAGSVQTNVARKVGYTFVANTTPAIRPVSPGDTNVDLSFTLTNTGNAGAVFDLDVAQLFPTGGNINLTYNPAGGSGTWHAVVIDPALGPSSAQVYDPSNLNGISIPEDGSRVLAIIASIPDVNDLDRDDFQLTVRALNDAGNAVLQEDRTGTGTDIVFADPGQNNIETGTGGYKVEAPVLSATKLAYVVEEVPAAGFNCASSGAAGNGAAFIPGACIEYEITVANASTASTSATNVYFLDNMPSAVTYAGATIEVVGGTTTATVILPGNGNVGAEIGELTPGMSAILRIRATVN